MSSRYSSLFARKNPSVAYRIMAILEDSPPFEDQDFELFSLHNDDVIYLAENENDGFVHYEHWIEGKLIRRLKYNNDYSWLSAAGEPEEWEKEILFTDEILSKTLQGYEPERHEEIKAVWMRKNIKEGDSFPVLGLLDFIGGINRYWKLPK